MVEPCRPAWKGELTARQRFRRQMGQQPVDRCFNMEFGYWEENFTQWRLFAENGITNNEQADAFLGFDPIHVVRPSVWMDPPFEWKVIEETESHQILQNGDGLLAEAPKQGSSIPHYIKSSIVTPDDWAREKAKRFDRSSDSRAVDVEAILRQHPPQRTYPLGIYCGSMIGKVRDMLTFEGLAYACCDYPDMVEDMVETACLLVENALDQILPRVEFDFASGWEDICFKNGPIVSVPFFRDVVMPRYKRIRRKLDAHGIDLWYTDCDGDVRPILPYLMEGGINCLFPFEVNCCTHPGHLLDEFGPDLRIMGGVDKMELAKGPDAIKRYLEGPRAVRGSGGIHPVLRPPLPAEREGSRLPLLP